LCLVGFSLDRMMGRWRVWSLVSLIFHDHIWTISFWIFIGRSDGRVVLLLKIALKDLLGAFAWENSRLFLICSYNGDLSNRSFTEESFMQFISAVANWLDWF
jgi:hypothetical protein